MPPSEHDDFLDMVCHPALLVRGGRIAAANARLARLTGYGPRELTGSRVRDLVAAGEQPPGPRPLSRQGLAPGAHDGVLVGKDGGRTGVRFVSRSVTSGHGPGGVLLVFDQMAGQGDCDTGAPDSERLLSECLRVVESGVVVIGRNGLVALANRRCCEILGYQELDIIGRQWASVFVMRRDRQRAGEHFERLLSGERPPRGYYESTVSTKGGQKRIAAWHSLRVLRDSSGRVQGIISSITDLTEQKEALKASEDRERLYRLVSENATAGVWTYDLATGCVTYMSPSIAQITGYSGDEVTSMTLEQILTPESHTFGMAELEQHLAQDGAYGGQPHTWTVELEENRKDGSTVWVEVRTSVMRDAAGRPTAIFGITRDITERKQAEKTLRDSEKRYRTFFENSMDATCILGRNGRILDLNPAALSLLGYSRDETAGLNLMRNVPREQRRRFQAQIEKDGFVRNFEMQIRRRDGVELDCVLTFDLRRDDYGNIVGYEGSIRDVSGYKRMQRNLRLYANEVTRAQEDERLRLSREIHDGVLQNLLALGLELEKAIRVGGREGGRQQSQLQSIRDEVQRLAKEMRAMSHALRPGVLDELGLVPAVQTLLRGLEETRGTKTELQVLGAESRLGAEIELALFRILQEALSNVKRHSEARWVRVRIEFSAAAVRMVVSDDGQGFEAPRRLSDLASERRLGLAGMEERARMLGGRVSLDSRPSAGTTITVEIPCAGPGAPGPDLS